MYGEWRRPIPLFVMYSTSIYCSNTTTGRLPVLITRTQKNAVVGRREAQDGEPLGTRTGMWFSGRTKPYARRSAHLVRMLSSYISLASEVGGAMTSDD